MKETKQPWPRSARVTVWALGIVIAASPLYLEEILIAKYLRSLTCINWILNIHQYHPHHKISA